MEYDKRLVIEQGDVAEAIHITRWFIECVKKTLSSNIARGMLKDIDKVKEAKALAEELLNLMTEQLPYCENGIILIVGWKHIQLVREMYEMREQAESKRN